MPPAADQAAVEQPRKRQRKAAAVVDAADEAAPATAAAEEAAPARKAGGKAKAAGGGPSREFERELWQQGYARVAGVDEAGRGPLAGPVVAAACVVPEHVDIAGMDDSKKLSAQQREALYAQLTGHPDVLWAACVVEAEEIDAINILQAALKAMEGAAAGLTAQPDFLLVDGNRLPKGFDPQRSRPIVKGDSKSYCIAAASVIAKVTRDRLMEQHHEHWPQYNFAGHKGYCVPEHVEAIRQHGPCPVHRRTFAPTRLWFPVGQADEGEAGSKAGSKEKNSKWQPKGKSKKAPAK